MCRLSGHQKLVYDLSWSRKGKYLLSASADGTARVWSLSEQKQEKVLAHPSFVYAAQFHPRVTTVVVTASYDSAVRVWGIDADRSEVRSQGNFWIFICRLKTLLSSLRTFWKSRFLVLSFFCVVFMRQLFAFHF